MKKLFILLTVSLLFIGGCNDEQMLKIETLSLENFSEAGYIHNQFLTNAKINFVELSSMQSTEEKINFINEFNKKLVDELEISEERKELLKTGLDNYKELVQTETLTSRAFHQISNGRITSDEVDIFQTIEALKSNGLISNFGYKLLISYSNDIKANYESILSDSELKSKTIQYISDFENHGYSVDSGEGEMIGNILAISIASIEWWEENPDAFEFDNENGRVMIAPWAAADIVGAAWGGTTGAIGSYAGTGEVNWTAVGVGALSGAIAGSTGAVGKIAKWLF